MQSEIRCAPPHGFTVQSLVVKRFNENTSATQLLLGLILPAMTNLNTQLEERLTSDNTADFYADELFGMMARSGKLGLRIYGDRIARVTVQTTVACACIKSSNETLNSLVYMWDLYPRLHQRYLGRVLRVFRIPRFIVSMLGPLPTEQDVKYLEGRSSAANAFGDSCKRRLFGLIGDVLIDTITIYIEMGASEKDRSAAVVKHCANRVAVVFCGATGAAIGRVVIGESGEYWGELAGALSTPLLFLSYRAIKSLKIRSSGSGERRPHKQASSPPAKKAAVA